MIDKEILSEIILDYQNNTLPPLVERELQNSINLEIPLNRATTISGPRRSGKTYFLYSLIKKLIHKGIKKERTLYINFENPRLVAIDLNDLISFLNAFYEIYPDNKKQKIWLFLDEIQRIENWEIFIRDLLEKRDAYIFISGSSSKLLSQEIATSLRGRTLDYLILPFSFKECLSLKDINYQKYLSSEEKAKILNIFSNYFSWGGYPEILLYARERKKIINEIIEVTIFRDLMERYNLRNLKVIKLMFNYLVQGRAFSIHKFYNYLKSLNIKVSKNSLYNYLEYFNDAYIFFPLRRFSWSLKNIEQSIPKIYSVDNGLIEAIVAENKGSKLENLVFLSLLRKELKPNKEIFYYLSSNSEEVDFVIKKGKKIMALIQASFSLSNYQTKEREVKALIKASQELNCSNLVIITYNEEGEEIIKDKKINYIPAWKWLLEEHHVL
jgi:hypothetical protein